eukprot:NODE_4461_length_784_cov_4.884323_g4302_i0.p1 GENE.NODE_4461_length_784_cov_4.884323_g4302_i0~~NODE_4461_length_784_cov_4.884323_g4302_i0.p1  ORF type:complete len:237 (+),score=30.92 NODE_4461_length_784_cov_4.884323_g4302_i0:69-713(+)
MSRATMISLGVASKGPGPGAYDVVYPVSAHCRGSKIGKAPRIDAHSLPQVGLDSPGPHFTPLNPAHIKGGSIGKQPTRRKEMQADQDPSPLSYVPHHLSSTRSIKFIPPADRPAAAATPGPGTYSIPEPPPTKAGAPRFATSLKESRAQWLDAKEDDSCNQSSFILLPLRKRALLTDWKPKLWGGTFGQSRRTAVELPRSLHYSPGPGEYVSEW